MIFTSQEHFIYYSVLLPDGNVSERFLQKAREDGREALEVCRNNSQMIAGNSLDLELLRQAAPDGRGVVGETRADPGPHELYFAGVKPGLVAGQSQKRAVPNTLHRRCQRYSRWRLIWFAAAEIPQRVQSSSCLPCDEAYALPQRQITQMRIRIDHREQRGLFSGCQ